MTHACKGVVAKLRINKAFIWNFLFDKLIYGATLANSCSFLLAFIHIYFECDIKS